MRCTLASFAAILFASAVSNAQSPPNLLHFQARLSDAAGVALNGAVAVEVRLYDTAVGGAPLWSETHNASALSGVVTLSLGSISALPPAIFDGTARYLGVRVAGDPEMTPRRQVLSVPYAARAGTVAALTAATAVPTGLITSAHIADGTIVGADIADFGIGPFKLAVGSVLSAQIGDGAVMGVDLADGSVSASKIAAFAVTTPAIANGSIFAVKIANETIDGSKILNGSIGSADLANGAVGTAQIASDSIDHTKILNGTITTFDIGAGAVTFNNLGDLSVGAQKLTDDAVTSAKLADNAVTSSKINDLAVTNFKINNSTITDAKISPLAGIQGSKVVPNFGAQPILTTGNVGAGTASPDARLHAFGTAFPNLLSERSTNFTTASATTLQCLARTSANMADGFGPSIVFSAVDSSGVVNDLAQIAASRDTADNRGRLEFRTYDGGTATTFMDVDREGRVGVGQNGGANPQYRMSVAGGSDGGILVNSTGFHGVTTLVQGSANSGLIGHNISVTGSGNGVFGISDSPSGTGVVSVGDFVASGTKAFVQPHPSDPSKELRFVCLEGVESGTYYRASAVLKDGVAVIEAPEAFRLATEADSATAVATPVGARAVVWIESESVDRIVVRGEADVKVNVIVNGTRRGFAAHAPIRENRFFVPEKRGVPFGTQYPDALRRVLVENGILNADFTPNEATAARLGWTLRDPEPAIPARAAAAIEDGGAR